jgi:hypothetical protein
MQVLVKKGVYGFVSDQSPMVKPKIYWTEFMGIVVPFIQE